MQKMPKLKNHYNQKDKLMFVFFFVQNAHFMHKIAFNLPIFAPKVQKCYKIIIIFVYFKGFLMCLWYNKNISSYFWE